jgi:hypothetical protein
MNRTPRSLVIAAGTVSLAFNNASSCTLTYTVNGMSANKAAILGL